MHTNTLQQAFLSQPPCSPYGGGGGGVGVVAFVV